MTLELLALAALVFSDPSGDAHGAGDLVPPSAPVYASRAPFDLVEVRVEDAAQLRIAVRLAGIPDPGGLPNGLTLPVLDLYLDTAEGGREELLPGPGMRMPAGRGWELALRVHGDDAYLVRADAVDGPVQPVEVRAQGDRLLLTTGVPRPETVRSVQALTGVYDPFARDAWRPLASSPSPWAFASGQAAPPVIDLLAADDAAQRDALRSFVLPDRRGRFGALPWLALMATGLVVALAGLLLRRRVPAGPSKVPQAAPATSRSRGAAGVGGGSEERPSERTLPTRLAAGDGWWTEAAADTPPTSEPASATPTWPAPTDRATPIWGLGSGPGDEVGASSEDTAEVDAEVDAEEEHDAASEDDAGARDEAPAHDAADERDPDRGPVASDDADGASSEAEETPDEPTERRRP